ncbi:hypothetical protein Lser_V15G07841 [Lactuca serriola]
MQKNADSFITCRSFNVNINKGTEIIFCTSKLAGDGTYKIC